MPGIVWACARCLRGAPQVRRRGPSDICDDCRAKLADERKFWCRACKRAEPLVAHAGRGLCYDQRAAYMRRWRAPHVPGAGYLTTREVARRLCVAVTTVNQQCRRGQLPGAVQRGPGARWYVPESALPPPPPRGGLSHRAIAAHLGVSAPTAAEWLRRGIVEVRGGTPVIVGPLPRIGRASSPAGRCARRLGIPRGTVYGWLARGTAAIVDGEVVRLR